MFQTFTNKRQIQIGVYLAIVVCILFYLSLLPQTVHAGAAALRSETIAQPNGDKFKASTYGDEWVNWTTTQTGDVVIKNTDGYWNYGKVVGDELKPSSKRFDPDTANVKIKPYSFSLKQADAAGFAKSAWASKAAARSAMAGPSKATSSNSSTTSSEVVSAGASTPFLGNVKMLTILVEFNDAKIKNTDATWNAKMFSSTGNSVRNYYNETSNGKLILMPAEETNGISNDGIVKVWIKTNHPNPTSTGAINQQIVKDALTLADQYVNFSSFDTNHDGTLTNNELDLVTIVAGYEMSYDSSTPHVWAHKWSLYGSTLAQYDGVYVAGNDTNSSYAQFGEFHGLVNTASIGVICHELGHTLGLPDLYDTTGKSAGIGISSIMAYGSWNTIPGGQLGDTPDHFDAWSKQQLGFVTPEVIATSVNQTYTLKSISTGQYNAIRINTSLPYEYFLLENRQFEKYDRSLNPRVDKGGIAIWHIDESKSGNQTVTQKLVDLMEANEGIIGYSENDTSQAYSPSRPYYSVGNVTDANQTSKPNTNFNSNYPSGLSISVKSAPSPSMDVLINYKINDLSPPSQPMDLIASANGATGVTLSWSPSYDNYGVTGYSIFQDLSPIGTSSTSSFSLSGLTPGQSYSFSVQGYDAAGNKSPMSTSVSITLQVVSSPPLLIYYKSSFTGAPYMHYRLTGGTWTTTPGILMNGSDVSGYSSLMIDPMTAPSIEAAFTNGDGVTWDNKGGTNYIIPVGSAAVTIENNQMKIGKPVIVTTVIDTSAPTVPTTIVSLAKTDTTVNLSWTASTDDIGVTGYEISRNGVKVGNSTATTYNDAGLIANTSYGYTVRAFDASGNYSAASTALSVITNPKIVTTVNSVTVYYKRTITTGTQYIHWRPVGGTWTTAPGLAMSVAEVNGYAKATLSIGTATSIEAAFNINGSWDSKGGLNYSIPMGIQTVEGGIVKAGAPAGVTIDSIAPTVPTNVTSPSKTTTSVGLSWTVSTDNLGVTGYNILRNGTKVGTSTTASYTDTALLANTAYSYTIVAFDAANNLSSASTPLIVTTNPATPVINNTLTIYYKRIVTTGNQYMHWHPVGGAWTTAPGLAMTPAEVAGYAKSTVSIGSATSIEAAFTVNGSTWDNKGGSNYFISMGTQTVENGVVKSGVPVVVIADTTAPSIPSNVTSPSKTDTTVGLSWNASTDNIAVTGYNVLRNGTKVGTTVTTAYSDNGLVANTAYSYTIQAFDAANNLSSASMPLTVTTNLATPVINNSLTIYYKQSISTGNQYMHWHPVGGTWTTAPGLAMTPAEVAGYAKTTVSIGSATSIEAAFTKDGKVWDNKNGANYLIPMGIQTIDNGLIKIGVPTSVIADTVAPSIPSNVTSPSKTDTTVGLSWNASTDNIGVTGYNILRNGTKIGTTVTTAYSDNGLVANTAYSYTIQAFDASNNASLASAAISITTNPSTPVTNNTITIYYKRTGLSGTQYLHWRPTGGNWTVAPGLAMTASDVSGYDKVTISIGAATTIEAAFNCNGVWDNKGGPNYTIPMGTQTVENSAIKTGAPTVTVTPTDTTAPSIPVNLISQSKTDKSVQLVWTASTDNIGVVGYEIYRSGTKIGTSSTTSYSDSGLTANTAYSYTVKAYDAAANYSATSSALSVTTNPVIAAVNTVTVYYKRKVATGTQNIHYRPIGGTWTAAPGVPMTNDLNGFAKITVTIGSASGIEAAFNASNTNWDSNNNMNYKTGTGDWTIDNGVLKAGKPY